MAKASDRLIDDEARRAADLVRERRDHARSLAHGDGRKASSRASSSASSRLKDEGGPSDAPDARERKLKKRDRRYIAKRHARRLASLAAGAASRALDDGQQDSDDVQGCSAEAANAMREAHGCRKAANAAARKTDLAAKNAVSGAAGAAAASEAAQATRGRDAGAANSARTPERTHGPASQKGAYAQKGTRSANAPRAANGAKRADVAARAAKERARDVARRASVRAKVAAGAVENAAVAEQSAQIAARAALRAHGSQAARAATRAFAKASVAGTAALAMLIPLFVVLAVVAFSAIGAATADNSWNMEGLSANERAVAEYFRSCGLGKVQVAAIMGNVARETGKTFDPATEQNPGGPGGIGLLQWGHLVDGGRGDQMGAWASSIGKPWSDMQVQLDWCWAEMANEGPARDQTSWYSAFSSPGEIAAFKEQTDVEAATRQFYRWMENPGTAGVPAMDERIEYAKGYLALFRRGRSEGDAEAVIDIAYSKLGAPYVFGAAGPDAFDCSGFVKWCFEQCGVSIPGRTADQIYRASMPISEEEARPGDIVVFTYGSPQLGELYGHIGIYLGDGMMIDTASAPQGVKVGAVGTGAAYGRLL